MSQTKHMVLTNKTSKVHQNDQSLVKLIILNSHCDLQLAKLTIMIWHLLKPTILIWLFNLHIYFA
jgi:hypothetical protein